VNAGHALGRSGWSREGNEPSSRPGSHAVFIARNTSEKLEQHPAAYSSVQVLTLASELLMRIATFLSLGLLGVAGFIGCNGDEDLIPPPVKPPIGSAGEAGSPAASAGAGGAPQSSGGEGGGVTAGSGGAPVGGEAGAAAGSGGETAAGEGGESAAAAGVGGEGGA
jgi:hypothetical protein